MHCYTGDRGVSHTHLQTQLPSSLAESPFFPGSVLSLVTQKIIPNHGSVSLGSRTFFKFLNFIFDLFQGVTEFTVLLHQMLSVVVPISLSGQVLPATASPLHFDPQHH